MKTNDSQLPQGNVNFSSNRSLASGLYALPSKTCAVKNEEYSSTETIYGKDGRIVSQSTFDKNGDQISEIDFMPDGITPDTITKFNPGGTVLSFTNYGENGKALSLTEFAADGVTPNSITNFALDGRTATDITTFNEDNSATWTKLSSDGVTPSFISMIGKDKSFTTVGADGHTEIASGKINPNGTISLTTLRRILTMPLTPKTRKVEV